MEDDTKVMTMVMDPLLARADKIKEMLLLHESGELKDEQNIAVLNTVIMGLLVPFSMVLRQTQQPPSGDNVIPRTKH